MMSVKTPKHSGFSPTLAAAFTLISAAFASGCAKTGPTLWIYTSLYPQVIESLKPQLKEKFPNADIRFFQAGSENIATKVTSELVAGKTQADILMTSDLFWYEDLKTKKALLPYQSPATAKVPVAFKDPDHSWAASRVPVMVIAYNSEAISASEAPQSFADLALPRFKDKVAMPSPIESGTMFTAVALIQRKLGWDFFSKLRSNGAIATGGNSAVMARIESKERPIGIVLLENVLATRKKNPKIRAVYPAEGGVTVPSPVAIMATTAQPELSKKVYDFFFSQDAQTTIAKGDMYPILADIPAPAGAEPWPKVLAASLPWDHALIEDVRAKRDPIKQRFSKIMLE